MNPDQSELEYEVHGVLDEQSVTRAYERDLLWVLLNDPTEETRQALVVVDETDFDDPVHTELFRWMRKMYRRDGTVEPIELISTMSQHGRKALADAALDLWGNLPRFGQPHSWRVVHYATRVHQLAQQRRLRQIAAAEHRALSGDSARLPDGSRIEAGTPPEEVIAATHLARRMVAKAGDRSGLSRPLRSFRGEAISEASSGALSFGFRGLDELLKGGARESTLVVVGGRPGMGKTAFLMNAVRSWTLDGTPGVVFSLEMAGHQLYQRLLSDQTELDRALWPQNLARVEAVADRLDRWDLEVADQPSLTIEQIRAECDRRASTGKLGWIVVDYLTLMGSTGRHERNDLAVGANSKGLKEIAKEFQIPVLLACQLNRDLEKRADKRPMVSDLREAGQIEQDADVILFLYREHVYDVAADPTWAEFIVAKHRGGQTGTTPICWRGELTRFEDPIMSDSVRV